MTIKNLLIDLDGTLTDPKVGIHTCIRYAMEKLGYPLKPDLDIDWTIGPPLKASFVKLLDNGDEQLAEQALLGYRERFSVVGLFENKVYPAVPETLGYLQEQGVSIISCHSKTCYLCQTNFGTFSARRLFYSNLWKRVER